jgi:hypothetical protein
MERTLMDRGANRTAAKEDWRSLVPHRRAVSFNDFWRARNDADHAARAAHQQKNSLKRRVK